MKLKTLHKANRTNISHQNALWFPTTSQRGWDSSLNRKQTCLKHWPVACTLPSAVSKPRMPCMFFAVEKSDMSDAIMQSMVWFFNPALLREVDERTVLHNFLSHQILQILISALDWGSWWLRSSDRHPIPAKIEVTS